MRETGTPIWVGEFGPVYTGDPERDEMRYQVLADQLELYERHAAGWSLWTYKDVGLQGLVTVAPESPYLARFGDLIAKKARLGVDSWGSTDAELPELFEPLHALIATEFGAGRRIRGTRARAPTTSCATCCWPRRCCPSTPSASAAWTTTSSTRWRTPSGWRAASRGRLHAAVLREVLAAGTAGKLGSSRPFPTRAGWRP